MTDNHGREFPEVVKGEVTIKATIAGRPRRDHEAGLTEERFKRHGLVFKCTEGVLRDMYFDARQGLSTALGGTQPSSNVEIKGFLLGTATKTEGHVEVVATERLPLKIDAGDTFDSAGFSATDYATLKQELSRKTSLKLIGCYHSHPNHGIKLSEQDVSFLNKHFGEPYHVSAIVKPALSSSEQGGVGFFAKPEGSSFLQHRDPIKTVKYDNQGRLQKPKVPEPPGGLPWRWIASVSTIVLVLAYLLVAWTNQTYPFHVSDPPLGAQFELLDFKSKIDFGRLNISDSGELIKTFHNPGDKPAKVKMSMVGPESHLFSISPNTLTIEAKAQYQCTLSFDGTPSAGNYQVDLIASGNIEQDVRIPITAMVIQDTIPLEQRDWPNPGRLRTNSSGVIVEVNHPSPGMRVQSTLEVYLGSERKRYIEKDLLLEPSEDKKRISINLGPSELNLKDRNGYLNVTISGNGVNPDTGGDVNYMPTKLNPYTRGSDNWSLSIEEKNAESRDFEFELKLPDDIVGSEVDIYEDSNPVPYRTVSISSGNTAKIFYNGSQKQTSSLKFVMQVLEKNNDGTLTGNKDKFWRRFERILELRSPDDDFISNQGPQARRLMQENRVLYQDLGLREIGKIPGLPYIDDLENLGSEYFYIELARKKRVPLSKWRGVQSLLGELRSTGIGRLAWCDYRDKKDVVLILVVPMDWFSLESEYQNWIHRAYSTLGLNGHQFQVLKQDDRYKHSEGELQGIIEY